MAATAPRPRGLAADSRSALFAGDSVVDKRDHKRVGVISKVADQSDSDDDYSDEDMAPEVWRHASATPAAPKTASGASFRGRVNSTPPQNLSACKPPSAQELAEGTSRVYWLNPFDEDADEYEGEVERCEDLTLQDRGAACA